VKRRRHKWKKKEFVNVQTVYATVALAPLPSVNVQRNANVVAHAAIASVAGSDLWK